MEKNPSRLFLFFVLLPTFLNLANVLYADDHSENPLRKLTIEQKLLEEQKKYIENRLSASPSGELSREEKVRRQSAEKLLKVMKKKEELAKKKLTQQQKREASLKAKEQINQKERSSAKDIKKAKQEVRMQKMKEKDAIRKANLAYRDIYAAGKAKLLVDAGDKLNELERILDEDSLPDKYKQAFKKRYFKASDWLSRLEGKTKGKSSMVMEAKIEEAVVRQEPQIHEKPAKINIKEARKAEKEQRKEEARLLKLRKKEEKILAKHQKKLEKMNSQKLGDLVDKENVKEAKRLDELRETREKDFKRKEVYLAKDIDRLQKNQAKLNSQIKGQRQSGLKEVQAINQAWTNELDALYKEAIDLYKRGEYRKAVLVFNDVDDIFPNYKLTRSYLSILSQQESLKEITMKEPSLKEDSHKNTVVTKVLDMFEESIQ